MKYKKGERKGLLMYLEIMEPCSKVSINMKFVSKNYAGMQGGFTSPGVIYQHRYLKSPVY